MQTLDVETIPVLRSLPFGFLQCLWLRAARRNDAGLAAAELALAVEKAVLATGALDAVGTTGRVELGPNTVNSVPREAKLEIDIRDVDAERRDRVVNTVLEVLWRGCRCHGIPSTPLLVKHNIRSRPESPWSSTCVLEGKLGFGSDDNAGNAHAEQKFGSTLLI